jgi:hypothetical protein
MQLAASSHSNPQLHSPHNNSLNTNQTSQEEEAVITNEIFRYTYSTPLNEIHDIIKQMRSNAAPGPDGLNAGFTNPLGIGLKMTFIKLLRTFILMLIYPRILTKPLSHLFQKRLTLLLLRISGLSAYAMSSTRSSPSP